MFEVDLDRFEPVNDVHGHAAGDALLKWIAARVASRLEADELFARTGGEEVVALKRGCGRDEALAFLGQPHEARDDQLDLEGSRLSVGASVGLALHPDESRDASALLGRGDLSLHRAKSERVDAFRLYDRRMGEALRLRPAIAIAIAMRLRRALAQGASRLVCQALSRPRPGSMR